MIERWDDLRFLLALAREGTLTAAATALGVSQPTVGRRISALEKEVGTPLIEKRPDGYRLSDAGEAVLAQAERVEAAVLAADRATAFNSRRMRGTVKLTSAEWLCGAVLAPAIARLSEAQRCAVVLVVGFGYTLREAAEVLGVTASTVHRDCERALARLRSELEVENAH